MERSYLRSLGCCAVLIAGTVLVSAIAAARAAAVVAPTLYANEAKLGTSPMPILSRGKIQFHSSTQGQIQCEDTFYATGDNEGTVANAHAHVEVFGWDAVDCEAPTHILELETSEPYKAEIERWIKEHGANIAEPKSPIKCAAPETKAGELKCLTVFATAERPIEREETKGRVCKEKPFEEGRTLAECETNGETEEKNVVRALRRGRSSLPWRLELARAIRNPEGEEVEGVVAKVGLHEFGESGTAEGQSTACFPKSGGIAANFSKVPSGCLLVTATFPQIPLEFVAYGTQEIFVVDGEKSGLFPSQLYFVEPTGLLFTSENTGGEGKLTTPTGESQIVAGARHVELITAKCEREPNKFEEPC